MTNDLWRRRSTHAIPHKMPEREQDQQDGTILNVDLPDNFGGSRSTALEGPQGKSFVPLLSGDIPEDYEPQ